MEPVSIIIPTYNGLELLKSLLPSFSKFIQLRQDYELIVVDDGSRDGTETYLSQHFPEIKLVSLKRNKGFGVACNRGVMEAKHDLILLLNNDVRFDSDFLSKPIQTLNNWRSRSKQIFAVTCKVVKEDRKTFYHGGNKGIFRRGEIVITPSEDKREVTFFASGVMMVFRKDLFLELGGFDDLYHPFYWEDVDLCYRALKRGYQILYEPGCLIYHNDQQTTVFSKTGNVSLFFAKMYARIIQERNQYLFTWKNIFDHDMIFKHIVWIPVHLILSLRNKDHIFKSIGFLFALFRLRKALRRRQEERKKGTAIQDHQLLNMRGN
jgi:GT2 family glycosyltransferase